MPPKKKPKVSPPTQRCDEICDALEARGQDTLLPGVCVTNATWYREVPILKYIDSGSHIGYLNSVFVCETHEKKYRHPDDNIENWIDYEWDSTEEIAEWKNRERYIVIPVLQPKTNAEEHDVPVYFGDQNIMFPVRESERLPTDRPTKYGEKYIAGILVFPGGGTSTNEIIRSVNYYRDTGSWIKTPSKQIDKNRVKWFVYRDSDKDADVFERHDIELITGL